MNENGKLPDGWIEACLGALVRPTSAKYSPNRKTDQKYVGLEHIAKGEGKLLGHGHSSEVRSTKTVFKKGDLLYGKLRPYLNKVVVAEFDGISSTDILVYTASECLSMRYLKYRMLQDDFVRFANLSVSGVQHPRTDNDKLSTFPVRVAPLSEQHRIVAKIEELFTRLDAGVEALKQIKLQLKRYRQAVLKHAFEGKLTQEWREAQLKDPHSPLNNESAAVLLERIKAERKQALGKKYKELPPVDTTDLPDLPEGWVWASVAELGEVVTGTTPSKAVSAYYGGEYPFFKPTDLNAGYNVRSAEDSLTEDGVAESRLLPELSVLVTCIGATIGKTGLIRNKGASNQQINAIIPRKACKPEYLYWVCISSDFQQRILDNASATTLPILNKSRFELLPLPTPSIEEQKLIVSEFERCFSIADAIEHTIDNTLAESNRLRQAILKRAFEGKLVPQDSNDEPAEKLLERIRAEREGEQERKKNGKLQGRKPVKKSRVKAKK